MIKSLVAAAVLGILTSRVQGLELGVAKKEIDVKRGHSPKKLKLA